jgi:hypothetical protein
MTFCKESGVLPKKRYNTDSKTSDQMRPKRRRGWLPCERVIYVNVTLFVLQGNDRLSRSFSRLNSQLDHHTFCFCMCIFLLLISRRRWQREFQRQTQLQSWNKTADKYSKRYTESRRKWSQYTWHWFQGMKFPAVFFVASFIAISGSHVNVVYNPHAWLDACISKQGQLSVN